MPLQLLPRLVLASYVLTVLSACGTARPAQDIASIPDERAVELDRALAGVMERHQVNTAGIAVIKSGEVVWSTHYGQQAPGVPASDETLYNVASITKTVVAETVLRLAEEGRLSLDEPMSAHWLDPDLEGDPRHWQLTPRMALTHTTGFMNWRFFADDGNLKFVNDPGTSYGYSGEGFNYLARFTEAKLDEPFEQLVQRYVFEPSGVREAALSVDPDLFPRIAQPLDADGQFPGYYCRPEGWCRDAGSFSAAGSMVITLDDYARFLIQAMHGAGLSPELLAERNTLHTEQESIDCTPVPQARCPVRVGYGLGWHVFELENGKTIGHLGSDWAEVAMAYYYEGSRDGLVVLLNAPNRAGIAAMVDILELLDPDSPELHGYVARRARSAG
ncbi:MAG: serine hydrolase domain-containing protein [Bacteroidota bacterium]